MNTDIKLSIQNFTYTIRVQSYTMLSFYSAPSLQSRIEILRDGILVGFLTGTDLEKNPQFSHGNCMTINQTGIFHNQKGRNLAINILNSLKKETLEEAIICFFH